MADVLGVHYGVVPELAPDTPCEGGYRPCGRPSVTYQFVVVPTDCVNAGVVEFHPSCRVCADDLLAWDGEPL